MRPAGFVTAADASSAWPMKVRPMPFARAPGVEKFHCTAGNTSSLVCAAAGTTTPTVAATISAARTARIIFIPESPWRMSALSVEDFRYLVVDLEPGHRLPHLADALRVDR